MKTQNHIRIALLCAAALSTHVAFAANGPKPPPPQPSSGTLVLKYPGPDGQVAYNWGLAVAPSGWIYAVGSTYPTDFTTGRQLVLASGGSGSSFSLLDDFAPPGRFVFFSFDLGGGITSDSLGNLYVTGRSYDIDAILPDHWYIRRSADDGATWTTVDDFELSVMDGSDEIAIAADAMSNVYTSGCANNQLSPWIVRKGVGGTSFSTVDSLPNSYPKDIFVHPTAGIFVVGQTTITIKNQTSQAWLVRRSTDGGASWSNVDVFQLASSKSSVAMGIAANASSIYVVGHAYNVDKNLTFDHWIVRKSTDGGNSWTTVDNYQLVADNSTQARCIAADANGNLVVAGSAAGKWIVRKSAGGTGTWTTVDVFQNGTSATTPNAIAADASGNVFVGGDDRSNWLIKKY